MSEAEGLGGEKHESEEDEDHVDDGNDEDREDEDDEDVEFIRERHRKAQEEIITRKAEWAKLGIHETRCKKNIISFFSRSSATLHTGTETLWI